MNGVVGDVRELAEELRAVVRSFLEDRAPLTEARRFLEPGREYDAALWSTMAGELGLQGLMIAEEHGGAGAGWREAAVVAEEMGRALLPSAYFASVVLAGTTIAASADDVVKPELLAELADGETTAALAVLEDAGRWSTAGFGLTASRDGDTYRLNGHKTFVLDGHLADVLVVAARNGLFVVDGDSAGLDRTALPTLDPTRPQARLRFDDVPARLLGAEREAERVLAHTYDRALLVVAADALGGAERCLEMALAYAKERVAFGRPIGGFQAIKHKLADIYLEVELARSAVDKAARAADAADSDELSLLASLALAQGVETYALAATENIHIHGGTGFTWEHDAQLFFRRAKSSQLLFGDATVHRERVAAHVLGDAVDYD